MKKTSVIIFILLAVSLISPNTVGQGDLIVEYDTEIVAGTNATIYVKSTFDVSQFNISYSNMTLYSDLNISGNINASINLPIPSYWSGEYSILFTFTNNNVTVLEKTYNFFITPKLIQPRGIGNYEIIWDGTNITVLKAFSKISYTYVVTYNPDIGRHQYYSNITGIGDFTHMTYNQTYIYYEV